MPAERPDGPGTDSPGSIFLRFLKFGINAWGGPAAQIEMIRKECVEDEGWVTAETFKKTLAVYQVLPGPEAHELCVFFGRVRGGKLGGMLAGLGFMLPGFILMLALSVAYVELDLAGKLDDVFYGLKAAVGALVARAVLRLGQNFISDVPLALIAAAAFVLTLTGSIGFVLILLAAGIAYELWINRARWSRSSNLFSLPALPMMPLSALAIATISFSLGAEIFLEGLKAGLLTFGGAYTVIPFLQQAAVTNHGWLTETQFIDGLALSGALPAPLIIFSTFVGYLAGGWAGALIMTFGIFLPAFAFPIFFHRQLVAVAENPKVRPFLLGVAAAVIGLIAAVTVDLLEAGIVDVPTALLAVAAFYVLYRYHSRATVVLVILGCGALGALWQLL
ncbi:MAG: chromate efflux transporter [Actinomycetota bacterium]|nr:chromate efflux transporter [Actinomycetota bacterium]